MSTPPPPAFLLDANVFIEAHRRYYGFALCPGFWDCLLHCSSNGQLLSIDRVKAELAGSGDELSAWATSAPAEFFASSLDGLVAEQYREVVRWVYGNAQFLKSAQDDFCSGGADPWLVAYARVYGGIIVTQEVTRPEARSRVPLPNVCDQFNIAYLDTFTMLRRLGARFEWAPPG